MRRSVAGMIAAVALSLLANGRARTAPAEVIVAAIQAPSRRASSVNPRCDDGDGGCAVETLVRRAHARGARLVVAPEHVIDMPVPEPEPTLGSRPPPDGDAPKQAHFAALADELDLYLVINLDTKAGERSRNTQLAFDPNGRVVGKHHKFKLYGPEKGVYAAGDSVMAFDTPFGRVGLLICADIYGDPRLHDALVREHGARIVALSMAWTVSGAPRWQAAFARDWGLYVVGANASAGDGRGGGVFGPDGRALAMSETGQPAVVLATIP